MSDDRNINIDSLMNSEIRGNVDACRIVMTIAVRNQWSVYETLAFFVSLLLMTHQQGIFRSMAVNEGLSVNRVFSDFIADIVSSFAASSGWFRHGVSQDQEQAQQVKDTIVELTQTVSDAIQTALSELTLIDSIEKADAN